MRRPWRVAFLIGLAACGTPTGSLRYQVTYQVTGTVNVTFDSVMYEDAQGTLVKVATPPSGWSVAFPAMTGDYVQAFAWARVTLDGGAAKLKATWTARGASTASDSSIWVTTAPDAFPLVVQRRRI